jgi:signal transduction histidine kinase
VNSLEAAVHGAKVRLPAVVVDIVLTLVSEATVLWGVAASQSYQKTAWPWWVWVFGAVIPLPVLFRRSAPFTAWLVMGLVMLLFAFLKNKAVNFNHSTEFPFLVACATVAYLGTMSQFVAAFALSIAGFFLAGHENLARVLITGLSISLAFSFGRLAAKQRESSMFLAERVKEADRAAEARAAEAAAEERTRIARDMHDILAHAVSLIVVQAEAGGAIARTSPDKAQQIFDAIGDAGRDSLTQLRRMLGVLREDEAVVRAPQPTIAALPELIESVRSAEIDVQWVTMGTSRSLPPDAEIAVYRTVQESLTNVVKHARACRVRVELDWRPDALNVHIADDGIGTAERGRGTTSTGPTRATTGRGLIGIQERISSCGGSVAAGPGPEGRGFRVSASVPLEPRLG